MDKNNSQMEKGQNHFFIQQSKSETTWVKMLTVSMNKSQRSQDYPMLQTEVFLILVKLVTIKILSNNNINRRVPWEVLVP